MKVTFQREQIGSGPFAEEMKTLMVRQWKEIALDQDDIPLDPDWDCYAQAEAQGILHIITARDGDKLVGWYVSIVRPHPHYKTTLFGFNDIYYMLPEYRTPTAGLGLFTAMEKSMRDLGVKELISITKTHHNVAPLFDRLGWRETGITYTKVLK